VLRPRAALTVDFLKSRRSSLLPALGHELLWFSRRLSWPCGAVRCGRGLTVPRTVPVYLATWFLLSHGNERPAPAPELNRRDRSTFTHRRLCALQILPIVRLSAEAASCVTQVQVPTRKSGRFDCVGCGATIHSWYGVFDYSGCRAVRMDRGRGNADPTFTNPATFVGPSDPRRRGLSKPGRPAVSEAATSDHGGKLLAIDGIGHR
jgi:hypothetical protein